MVHHKWGASRFDTIFMICIDLYLNFCLGLSTYLEFPMLVVCKGTNISKQLETWSFRFPIAYMKQLFFLNNWIHEIVGFLLHTWKNFWDGHPPAKQVNKLPLDIGNNIHDRQKAARCKFHISLSSIFIPILTRKGLIDEWAGDFTSIIL